jgi:hypothetical protein
MMEERVLKDGSFKKVITPKLFIKHCRYCDNCKKVTSKLDKYMVIYEYQINCLISNTDCKKQIELGFIR